MLAKTKQKTKNDEFYFYAVKRKKSPKAPAGCAANHNISLSML